MRRTFVYLLLAVVLLDEFVFSVETAAWPLIRDDFSLSYAQVGLVLSLPVLVSVFIEPIIGILGDVWRRQWLVIGGGFVFAGTLVAFALSDSFALLIVIFAVMYPASGSFVSLSQATLMDGEPERHQQNMARWTFAGSLSYVIGPLALSGALLLGFGWRGLIFGAAIVMVGLSLTLRHFEFPRDISDDTPTTFREGLQNALKAMRRVTVMRWLILLVFSDLMLDILFSFLTLYFVDVAGASPVEATFAVTIWTGVGLLGDLLLIPLLERMNGLRYLTISAVLEAIIFSAFLLVDNLIVKFVLLGMLGFFNAGWYSILQGQLYSSMRGQSGTVLALNNFSGLVTSAIPFTLGLIASAYGLDTMMWVMLLGPAALFVGLRVKVPEEISQYVE